MATTVIATADSDLRDFVIDCVGPDMFVVACPDSQTALDHVRKNDADLLISDVQVSNMGGYALCMDVKLDQSVGKSGNTKVLLLLDREVDSFLARRMHADDWLLKPLDPVQLSKTVDVLVNELTGSLVD